jgi:hypothetical protein
MDLAYRVFNRPVLSSASVRDNRGLEISGYYGNLEISGRDFVSLADIKFCRNIVFI